MSKHKVNCLLNLPHRRKTGGFTTGSVSNLKCFEGVDVLFGSPSGSNFHCSQLQAFTSLYLY